MLGSLAWRALMRRNMIYRKRNWLGSIFEFILPFCFVWVLVAIKNASKLDQAERIDAKTPQDYPDSFNNPNPLLREENPFPFRPFSYYDFEVAMQSERICTTAADEDFDISGYLNRGTDWSIPFIRCDTRKCQFLGQDAHPFCEYMMLAVSSVNGGEARASEFKQWFYDRFPIMSRTRSPQQAGTPFEFEFVQVFDSPSVMDEYVKSKEYGVDRPKIAMGIVFDGSDELDYKYWIRQNSTNFSAPAKDSRNQVSQTTPPTDRLFNHFAETDFETCFRHGGLPNLGTLRSSCTGQYVYNGVLATQRLIGDFILNKTGAQDAGFGVADAGVQYVQFPQEEFILDGFFASVEQTGPLLMVLGLLYPVAMMISRVVREKELRQKELMKMMSVTESDIGWSWFMSFFLFHLCTATVTALISSILFDRSSFLILWMFWILVFLAVIVFCLTLSSFSSKNARSVLIGLLVFFSGIFLNLAVDRTDFSRSLVNFLSIHPIGALSYGLQVIGRLEDIELGLVRSTVGFSDVISEHSFRDVLASLLIGIVFWSVLAWYLNRVIPPAYGQGLPVWFPFVPSYWAPSMAHSNRNQDWHDEESGSVIPIEAVGADLEQQSETGSSIEIKALKKSYGKKTAVDGLSLSMYRGQITALLGHNGAGKTTTINMLTGATAPTGGTATVAGKDIRTEMLEIRKDVGICLQHDCLFPQLTVREHLEFFARLKGLYKTETHKEAERQIDESIRDVALYDKRDTLSKNLSGGMKRKLSLAIAFCGGSQVVMLDEPTSGMDPFSRRFTWDVIRRYRENRCIVLTTHFMDEADVLGDRIAIMADGRLCCVGSSLFLKKTYGVGYQLTIEKSSKLDDSDDASEYSRVDTDKYIPDARFIVEEFVDDAKLLNDVGNELTYRLPLSSASGFTALFERLDEAEDAGAISSYGVSVTTLDEVFIMVTRGDREPFGPLKHANGNADETLEIEDSDESEDKYWTQGDLIDYRNDSLFFGHVAAMLWKRASYFRRDRKAWVFTSILPSVFVLIGLIIFVVAAPDRNLDPLPLDFDDYNSGPGENVIVYNSADNPYICQPGVAAHPNPLYKSDHTEESYLFGGYEGQLIELLEGQAVDLNNINPRALSPTKELCSVSKSEEIIATIQTDRVKLEPAGVRNTTESGAQPLRVSRFGAIWFTHDSDSETDRDRQLSAASVSQCNLARFVLDYIPDCNRFNGVGYVIQYNHTAIHAALVFEAIANEALVRRGTQRLDYTVSATIAPLPVTDTEDNIGAGEDAFAAWFLVMLSFPFIAGAYATFVVTEKKTKAKHLQTVAGVQPAAYWLATFVWDVLNYQIPLWITVALIFAFGVDILTTSERDVFSGILAILFLYGPASAGFTYCVTFAFKTASMCNVFIISFGFLIGMAGPLTCFILTVLGRDPRIDNPNLENIADILTWVLRFTPSFCFGNGLFRAINIDAFIFLEENETLSAWSEPILLYEVYFLVGQTFFYLILAMCLDRWSTNPQVLCIWRSFLGCFKASCFREKASTRPLPYLPDNDVVAENDRVMSKEANEDLIVMRKLRKVYDGGKVAVEDMSLGIPPGECFGLLGINGAGKTTTMGMLTAEFPPTSGDATLLGFSVVRHPEKIRRRIGYCPQFDAHFANLTGREHVELYASIKGVPRNLVRTVATDKLRQVGLNKFDSDRLSSEYSGGMKRRLSLACATVGQPQVIFLDECSTGVDPVARREIWKLVADMVAGRGLARDKKPSIILTTHSMDECEALCPRIGIMAQGRLRCLGSALHLKNKFGKGYQVELKHRIVSRRDRDYKDVRTKLKTMLRGPTGVNTPPIHLALCKEALQELIGTSVLADMVSDEHGPGFAIWRDASSMGGVSLDALAEFATSQIRTFELEKFVSQEFAGYVLREQQAAKSRFEIGSEGVRISKVFRLIEINLKRLYIEDYSVSQTSLEQVFNLHAAEAESAMTGRMEVCRPIERTSEKKKPRITIPAVSSNVTSTTVASPNSSNLPETFDESSDEVTI